jgi:hypothetical protein
MQSVLLRRIGNESRAKQIKRLNSDLNVLSALIRPGSAYDGACRNLFEAEFEKQNEAQTDIYWEFIRGVSGK